MSWQKKIDEEFNKIRFDKVVNPMIPNIDFGVKVPSWLRHLNKFKELEDDYPPSLAEYMKGEIKFYYGLTTLKMEMFQSPRGIRIKDPRPNKVSLKFKGKNMSAVDLKNLIEYLEVLQTSMSQKEGY